MNEPGFRISALIGILLLIIVLLVSPVAAGLDLSGENASVDQAAIHAKMLQLPLSFIHNQGQAPDNVKYFVHAEGHTISFTPENIVLIATADKNDQTVTSQVTMTFPGANASPEIIGLDQLPGKANYFKGGEASQWHINVPTYAAIQYTRLYPGIDLKYRGTEGNLKREFVVAPGAAPSQIVMAYDGIDSLKIAADGSLKILTSLGVLSDEKPVAYQVIDGKRVPVTVDYKFVGENMIGFDVGKYDPKYPLIIDPWLKYSSYIHGSSSGYFYGVTLDSDNNIYVVGYTGDSGWPTKDPYMAYSASTDVVVTELNPDGSAILYATYLGGSSYDLGYGIAVDPSGYFYITGGTTSSNFPRANSTATLNSTSTSSTGADAFVTKFSPGGQSLVYSTYLGGTGSYGQQGYGIAADASGNAYVSGITRSTTFPTVNASQPSINGSGYYDAFLAKFYPEGGVAYVTYLGGTKNENAKYSNFYRVPIAVDSSGNAYVAGSTQSTDFPITADAYQSTKTSNTHGFIAKYNATGNMTYATYLGGTTGNDYISALAVDSSGTIYVGGTTSSSDFPQGTTNGWRSSIPSSGGYNSFLAKLNASGKSLDFSTYFGGTIDYGVLGIALDRAGSMYAAGYTTNSSLPILNAVQNKNNGAGSLTEGYLFKVNPDGSSLLWSTYFGGSQNEYPTGIAYDGMGNITVAGYTTSSETQSFPLVNPLYATRAGTSNNGFVAIISEQSNATFTATNTSGKYPLLVQFTNTTDPADSFYWDFGDGTNATIPNPPHTFALPGNYSVNLTATNTYGSHATTQHILVLAGALPTADFTVNKTYGKSPITVQFTDNSTYYPNKWFWDFGDGTNSTEQNPTHTYNTLGFFTVSLNASNVDGYNLSTKQYLVTVTDTNSSPLSDYRNMNIYVANDEGVKYDVPNGVVVNTFTYKYVPNTYYVLFRSDGGGLNPMHISSASNGFDDLDLTTSTNQSGSFWITFGGGQPSMPNAVLMLAVNGSIPDDFKVHIRSSGQEFDVGAPTTSNQGMPTTVTFLDGAVNQTFEKNDFIYGPQSWKPCSISGYPIYYGENQTDLTNRFRIMFIDLRVGAVQNHSLTNNGMIKVEYEFTNLTSTAVFNTYGFYVQCNHGTGIIMTNELLNGAGVSSGYTVLGITSAPVANFTVNTTTPYASFPVQFMDTSENIATSWFWNFGDGTNSTSQNPLHTYVSEGTYNVTLNVTNSKGNDTKTILNYIAVSMPPEPVAKFSANVTSGSTPLTIQFTDGSDYPSSWRWDFGDGTNSTSQNPSHTYNLTGSYTVNLTVINAKGTSMIAKAGFITAHSAGSPVANFTATPVNGMAPLAVQFTDTSANGPTSWSWDFGDGSSSTSKNPSHTYSTTGTYNVSLTASNSAGTTSLNRTSLVYVTSATGAIPNYNDTYIRAANHDGIRWDTTGNGTYYLPGSGGGMSPIHITTDPTVTAGQVTVSRNDSGTIYATSSGTNADTLILLLAVNGTIPDNFAARVKTSGYTWTPTGSTPASGSLSYQSSALDQTFTKNDFFYGPQNWRPVTANANYPILYGEDMNSSVNQSINQYQLMFIDLEAGIPGTSYSGYSSLTNQGAVRIDYSFTNLPDNAVFNVYGWKKGTGMGWTNALTGASASGYSVISSTIPIPPVTNFSVDGTDGLAPYNAQFTDTSTNTPTSWSWDFGDGGTSALKNPTHTYSTKGTYSVTLTASNRGGTNTTIKSSYITVSDPKISTSEFTMTGVSTTTTGSAQNVSVDSANATTNGNIVTLANAGTNWSSVAIVLTDTPVTNTSGSTTTLEGTVSNVVANITTVTVPIPSLGNPVVNLSLSMSEVPGAGSSITTNVTSDPDTDTGSAFSLVATNSSKTISDIAYTLTVAKTGISNCGDGGIIRSVTITMTVSPTWVTTHAGGDTSRVVIMHRCDNGTTTLLTTTFTGTDTSGNYVFTALSPTGLSTFALAAVSPVTSTSNSGFSSVSVGGGIGETGRPSVVSTKMPAVNFGDSVTVSFTQTLTDDMPLGIRSVQIVPNQTIESTEVVVQDTSTAQVQKLSGRNVAGIEAIEVVNANPTAIDHAVITFALSGTWMKSYGLTPADIVMLRNHNAKWTELPTTFDHQDGDTYYFTATTPGFSYFAVASRVGSAATATATATLTKTSVPAAAQTTPAKIPVVTAKVTTVPTTSAPVAAMQTSAGSSPASVLPKGLNPKLVMFGGIAGIVIAIAGFVLYRRRKRQSLDPLRPKW